MACSASPPRDRGPTSGSPVLTARLPASRRTSRSSTGAGPILFPSAREGRFSGAWAGWSGPPTPHLDEVVRFNTTGIGLTSPSERSGVPPPGSTGSAPGLPGAVYHLEFTRKAGHVAGRRTDRLQSACLLPSLTNGSGTRRINRMVAAGYRPQRLCSIRTGIAPAVPLEDPDGYRVVFQNASWPD